MGPPVGFTFMTGGVLVVPPVSQGRQAEPRFRRGQLVSAAAFSLGHGGNDAQKTMGVILAVLVAERHPAERLRRARVGRPVGAPGDRARHAVRRVADRAHDGLEDHEAPAGRRMARRDRPRRSRWSSRRSAASRCRPRTRSPARSSASDDQQPLRRSLGRRGPRGVGLGADHPGRVHHGVRCVPTVQGNPMNKIARRTWFFLVIAVTMLLLVDPTPAQFRWVNLALAGLALFWFILFAIEDLSRARREGAGWEAPMKLKISNRAEVFFDLFSGAAENMRVAAELLLDMVSDFQEVELKARRIQEREHDGDTFTHEVIQHLNTTFITPMDREDIYSPGVGAGRRRRRDRGRAGPVRPAQHPRPRPAMIQPGRRARACRSSDRAGRQGPRVADRAVLEPYWIEINSLENEGTASTGAPWPTCSAGITRRWTCCAGRTSRDARGGARRPRERRQHRRGRGPEARLAFRGRRSGIGPGRLVAMIRGVADGDV